MKRRFFLLLLLILALPVTAQDATPTQTPEPAPFGAEESIAFGDVISGRIDNRTPRAAYYFDGLRGEFISVRMRVVDGDLDPVLVIMQADGTVLGASDDSEDSFDSTITTIRLASSGRYYIIAGRFGYGLGSTTGDYELELVREGVSSESGSVLRYGDTVLGSITNAEPQVYYTFHAQRGDILNIRMQSQSGRLDPYLQVIHVVEGNFFVIAYNDDVFGASNNDAVVSNLFIEEDGTYVIEASRYGQVAGNTTGSFVLTLEEARNSGLGNTAAAPIRIAPGQTVSSAINARNPRRYYTFEALENDVITIRMDLEAGTGLLDTYLILTDENLLPLIENDDGGSGRNALIADFIIPNDGTYYIIATRFEFENGISEGEYTLELTTSGNIFDGVDPTIERVGYGSTLTGVISDETPSVFYAFYGRAGEAVTVSMNRGDGDLDPVVRILNDDRRPVATNDDGGDGRNARIDRYVLQYTGVHYIEATRYTGTEGVSNTRGTYILVLARRVD